MSSNNESSIQRERVEKAVESAYDFSAVAVFDAEASSSWLRFRIDAEGAPLSQPVTYHVSEIADMSDDRLRQMVAALSPFFPKKLN